MQRKHSDRSPCTQPSPLLSTPLRPALPLICRYSPADSQRERTPSNLRSWLKTTDLAGMCKPMDRVSAEGQCTQPVSTCPRTCTAGCAQADALQQQLLSKWQAIAKCTWVLEMLQPGRDGNFVARTCCKQQLDQALLEQKLHELPQHRQHARVVHRDAAPQQWQQVGDGREPLVVLFACKEQHISSADPELCPK